MSSTRTSSRCASYGPECWWHRSDRTREHRVDARWSDPRRYSIRLDVCYATVPDNIRRLAELLREWQAYPRGWEQGLPFEMDARTFATTPILAFQTSQGELDFLDSVAGVGNFDKVPQASEEVAAFGIRVRALRLRELIAARRAAGRTRDLAQLPTLEALLELRKEPGKRA